jgi:hypothetical protein
MTTITNQTNIVETLIQTYKRTDPRLYDVISHLADQVDEITRKIQPVLIAFEERVVKRADLKPPTEVAYTLTPTTIRLSWARPQTTGFLNYEIRRGIIWEAATFITRTASTVVDIVPVAGAVQTYLLKTLNDVGEYSADTTFIVVEVVLPGPVAIDASVIDNNVLLRWSPSQASFAIDNYEIYREDELIGTVRGTFTTFFEMIAGEYDYEVVAVDIVGNRGVPSSVSLIVNQPPDYVLTNSYLSTLQGTRFNVALTNDPTLVA